MFDVLRSGAYWIWDFVNVHGPFICNIKENIICQYSFFSSLLIPEYFQKFHIQKYGFRIHPALKPWSYWVNTLNISRKITTVVLSMMVKKGPMGLRHYPKIRSIHSCKCSETCSLSSAIWCLWMKSTGLSAQGGRRTESETVGIRDKTN